VIETKNWGTNRSTGDTIAGFEGEKKKIPPYNERGITTINSKKKSNRNTMFCIKRRVTRFTQGVWVGRKMGFVRLTEDDEKRRVSKCRRTSRGVLGRTSKKGEKRATPEGKLITKKIRKHDLYR